MEALYILAYAGNAFDAFTLFGEGREVGRQCLRLNGAWVVMERLAGGRMTAQGLRRLDTADLPCVRGLLQHWIRWVEEAGVGARIDLRSLRLLADRSMELAGEDIQWVEHWSLGMIASLGQPTEKNWDLSEFHFQEAIRMAPGLATPAIDRLVGHFHQGLVSEALNESLRAMGRGEYPIHESAPWALQNQRALKRAIELLAQLRERKDE
jgi:hypothetical protein